MPIDAEGSIEGGVEFNTDLFEPASVERLAARLGAGGEHGVAWGSDAAVWALPMLPDCERSSCCGLQRHGGAVPADVCVHELVAARRRARPTRSRSSGRATR